MLKKQFGIESSFEIPLDAFISRMSDSGRPVVLAIPEGVTTVYHDLAECIVEKSMKLADIMDVPEVEYLAKDNMIEVRQKGEVKKIDPFELRLKCSCAACIDEFSGAALLNKNKVPSSVHPTKIERKGNYAVAVVWSDGHRSSIFPYKRLLAI